MSREALAYVCKPSEEDAQMLSDTTRQVNLIVAHCGLDLRPISSPLRPDRSVRLMPV